MADDHNDEPPDELAAAFSNSESSNDELEGNNEPAENAQEELAAATLQGTEAEAIVAQEPAVASLQRSTRFQEPAVMAANDMPDQPQNREDPGYEDKETTDSTKGAHDLLYLKHRSLDYKTARKLERMKSKILSGIELNSPNGSKQKAIGIQESEAASNGAAQARNLPRETQFQLEEGGGLFYGNYAPPDLPPAQSLQKFIQDCSKPFEKQLTASDVNKTKPRLNLNEEYVQNHIKPVLRNGENPDEGINVTIYNMEGKESSRLRAPIFMSLGKAGKLSVIIMDWLRRRIFVHCGFSTMSTMEASASQLIHEGCLCLKPSRKEDQEAELRLWTAIHVSGGFALGVPLHISDVLSITSILLGVL